MNCRSVEFNLSNCIVLKFMYSKFQLSNSQKMTKLLITKHATLVNTLYIASKHVQISPPLYKPMVLPLKWHDSLSKLLNHVDTSTF